MNPVRRPLVPDRALEIMPIGWQSTPLHYRFEAEAVVGARVVVPLGRREVTGIVIGTASCVDQDRLKLKSIIEVLDRPALIDEALMKFFRWIAEYYATSLGEVLKTGLPALVQSAPKSYVKLTQQGKSAWEKQQLAALLPQDEHMAAAQLKILQQLASSPGRKILKKQLLKQVRGNEIKQLQAQQWVEVVSVRRKPRAIGTAVAMDHASAARDNEQRTTGAAYEQPPTLTAEQQSALTPMVAALSATRFEAFLLHGVTGSGKTEIYLRLIAEALVAQRTAIVLVPEISLTPQLSARFRQRFGDLVAVWHSNLTDAQRYGLWQQMRDGQIRVIVGARSAIFAPLANLGVVVVDEEHDGSFKQEEGLRYNARDLALVRGQQSGAVVVLGSATPSLESYFRATESRLTLFELKHRATAAPMPAVEVINLRVYRPGPEGILSAPLATAIASTLARREQVIIFLNRRGFSTFVMCPSCGYVFRCEHCSVSLTLHQHVGRLVCHYCGFHQAKTNVCPACASAEIDQLGFGTERVVEYLMQRFSDARIARLDRDTAEGKGLHNTLAAVGRREVDILVGTQMITKGHDFHHVTLVGVLCADQGLHFPDFRAAERTFQLLTQVAGRAGRGEHAGQVIIQTYHPEHPSVVCAQAHDYKRFYEHEVMQRRELNFPPCGHLFAVRIDGADAAVVQTHAEQLGTYVQRWINSKRDADPLTDRVEILGPVAAPLQRLKGRTRWMLLVKCTTRPPLRHCLAALTHYASTIATHRVRVSYDIDPVNLL